MVRVGVSAIVRVAFLLFNVIGCVLVSGLVVACACFLMCVFVSLFICVCVSCVVCCVLLYGLFVFVMFVVLVCACLTVFCVNCIV